MESKFRLTARKRAILDTIKGAGVIAVIAIAPGIAKVVDKRLIDKILSSDRPYSYFRTLTGLEKKGLIRISTKGGKQIAELTKLGLKTLELSSPIKKKRWDRKWRVLIFDIPETRRGTREKIRITLRDKGFHRIQDSVWVLPYDCEDLVTLLKADLRIGKELLYMIVDSIEGDRKLKEIFGLN